MGLAEWSGRTGKARSECEGGPRARRANRSKFRLRAEIDERRAAELRAGLPATIYGRNLGSRTIRGEIATVKQVMGDKTVFSRSAAERHDLDVVQILIDLSHGEQLPVGLRVDVRIHLPQGTPRQP